VIKKSEVQQTSLHIDCLAEIALLNLGIPELLHGPYLAASHRLMHLVSVVVVEVDLMVEMAVGVESSEF